MTKEDIKRRIEGAIAALANVQTKGTQGLIPPSMTDGKLYEAHILAFVLEKMATREGFTVVFRAGRKSRGNRVALRSKGGPISGAFPHFELIRGGNIVAEVWTDIEFLALSYVEEGGGRAETRGDRHELDIVIVEPNVRRRPRPAEVFLGVECKNTKYEKHMIREILGVRRELSYYTGKRESTFFRVWPRASVSVHPPSCLAVFATDSDISDFQEPGKMFGIDFIHERLW
jgi:hypothetical protein